MRVRPRRERLSLTNMVALQRSEIVDLNDDRRYGDLHASKASGRVRLAANGG